MKNNTNFDTLTESPVRAPRGMERLTCPAMLPYIDLSATSGYEGSISKSGDNADWDWCLYQDSKDEYVLFETDGAGCLYNFTQHRYPASAEPVFRFYLDGAAVPALQIRQSEFWDLPAGGVYEGPEAGGCGPIWVVRNFMPMEFTTHCKVTSSVELKGWRKDHGEGGWGHVTYTLYDTPNGLAAYTGKEDITRLTSLIGSRGCDPKDSADNRVITRKDISVAAGKSVRVFRAEGAGSIASIRLSLRDSNASADALRSLRVRLFWDGHADADVSAPIGTLFGNEYGHAPCDIRTIMVGMNLNPGVSLDSYHYFPMPYWSSAVMELYNTGDTGLVVHSLEIQTAPSSAVSYSRASAGYFTSSDYHEVTANIRGRNSVIAMVEGTGHMVYGVLSGCGIESGCEGDVRVFFDGRESPEIESDGSESWASYGWGFATPPQSNAFSAYHGLAGSNADWSEIRLTIGDSYHFKSSLRFELEHGNCNDGMGTHSGQIFYYLLGAGNPAWEKTDSLDAGDPQSLKAHRYTAEGTYRVEKISSYYANGLPVKAVDGTIHTDFTGRLSFTVSIDPHNAGICLNRTSSQAKGRHAARIHVDGVLVKEKYWYYGDSNDICCWLDDSFQIPAAYTRGKSSITLTMEPFAADGSAVTWNHARYEIYSLFKIGCELS